MDAPSSPSSERHGSCVINDEPSSGENEDDDAAITTVDFSPENSNPTVQNTSSALTDENPLKLISRNKKKMKQRTAKDVSASQSSSSSSSLGSFQRGTRVACKRRNPRVVFGAARRNPVAYAISFRLGMSIAAFVAQVWFFFHLFFIWRLLVSRCCLKFAHLWFRILGLLIGCSMFTFWCFWSWNLLCFKGFDEKVFIFSISLWEILNFYPLFV